MATHTHTTSRRRPLAAARVTLVVTVTLLAPALADPAERLIERLDALDGDAGAKTDQGGEANANNDGPWWAPAIRLTHCGPLLTRPA